MTNPSTGAGFERETTGALTSIAERRNGFLLPSTPVQALGNKFSASTPMQKLEVA